MFSIVGKVRKLNPMNISAGCNVQQQSTNKLNKAWSSLIRRLMIDRFLTAASLDNNSHGVH